MTFLHGILSKVRATFLRRSRDVELNEEIDSHLAMLTAAHIGRGMPPTEARLAAKREFGGIELTKQIYREHRGLSFVENVLQDMRLALRSLRKNRGFAAVAIGSLAIGIGASTSMFSVVQALKFRSLSVPRPWELVQVRSFSPEYKNYSDTFSYPFVKELAEAQLFRSTAGMFPVTVALYDGGRTSQIPAELVTGDYFRTLEVKPVLGRLLTSQDMNQPGANSVCDISYSLWQSRFGGQTDVLHRAVSLNGQRFQIVGVTQADFQGSVLYWPHDIQIPVSMTAEFMSGFPWQSENSTYLYLFGRRAPGMTSAAAETRLKVIGPRIGLKLNPKFANRNRFIVKPASQGPGFSEDKTTQLSLLSGVVLLTLLIACANIACLLLARASVQEREIAVQLSLGAPRARILQRYLVESLLIAVVGGAAGVLASHWVTRVFLYVLRLGDLQVRPDGMMLLFSLAICVGTAVLFGLVPGWQASRVNARVIGLREHGSARVTRRQNLFSKGLVAFQIALATVLLIGFGLFLRTLQNVEAVGLGFDPRNVVITDLDPGKAGRSSAKALEIYRAVLDRVRLMPDVESATLAYGIPFSGFTFDSSFEAATLTRAHVRNLIIPTSFVDADYFRTLRMPILRGRDFKAGDFKRVRSVIVNRAFVDYYQLGEQALGRRFKLDQDTEIVGITGNAKGRSVREETAPAMFFPVTDDLKGSLSIVARTRRGNDNVSREIGKVVESVDGQTPILEQKQLLSMVQNQYFDQRAITTLCSIFSVFALILSCMGLYGVAAYSISRRTQEIGVRFAVGASRPDVARLFLRESCALIIAGLAVGVPAALMLGALVKMMLFGIKPTDPITIGVTAAALAAVCLAASALPLHKAFAVDPAAALRGE